MPEILKLPIPKGLRPESDLIYDLQYLEDCQNLYLNKNGVFEAEKFTRTTFSGSDPGNVSVQVFQSANTASVGAGYSYVVSLVLDPATDTVYGLGDSDTLSSLLGSIPDENRTNRWSCADFGRYAIMTNGAQTLVRNISTGAFAINNSLIPTCNAICAHRGRLILASPQGEPYTPVAGASNMIAWSKINDLTFQEVGTPDISNLSGWMPMEYPGETLRVEPLKNHIVVYSENGISVLTLAGQRGYGMTTIHPVGIKDAGSVCLNGNADGTTLQYFIDVTGDLFMIDASLQVTKLGYKEHFAADHTSYPGLIMMSYNSRRGEVLINFYGSSKTYVYNPLYGLTWLNDDIEALWEVNGARYVYAPSAISQTDIVYQTNIIDMGCDCQKYFWGFSARITAPEIVSVVIDYRKERTGPWTSTTARPFDKTRGYFNAGRLIGVEFRIKLTVESYTAFQLSDIEVKFSKINGGALES